MSTDKCRHEKMSTFFCRLFDCRHFDTQSWRHLKTFLETLFLFQRASSFEQTSPACAPKILNNFFLKLFFSKTLQKEAEFLGICKKNFHSRQTVLSFVRLYGVVSKFNFFALNLVGWNKAFRAFRPGKKLARASMRKLFDPQSWQPQDTSVLVVVCDPRTNEENWVWGLSVISIFIRFFCWFTRVEKHTCLTLR